MSTLLVIAGFAAVGYALSRLDRRLAEQEIRLGATRLRTRSDTTELRQALARLVAQEAANAARLDALEKPKPRTRKPKP